jgi:ribonuclease P protein component
MMNEFIMQLKESKTFPKNHRLHEKRTMEALLSGGIALMQKPVKLLWLASDSSKPSFKVAFSVPKKLFKRAVDRNLLKRRMREAFRVHQQLLKDNNGNRSYTLWYIYSSNNLTSFKEIEIAIVLTLQCLKDTK